MLRDLLPTPVQALLGALLVTAVTMSLPGTQARSADETRIREALADWVKANDAGDRRRSNQIWARDMIGYYPGQPDDTYEQEIAAESRASGPPKIKTTLSI